MKKQIIRLTENDLHKIIRKTVSSILRENFDTEKHVFKLNKKEDEELPMDMPPINEPPMGSPDDMGNEEPPMGSPDDMGSNEPPMGSPDDMGNEEPPMGSPDNMGNEEPPMGSPDDMGGENTQEIDDIFNNLSIEDQSAVLKYAKSMSNDNGNDENNGMPTENKHFNIDRIIEDVLGRDERGKTRTSKRPNKKIAGGTRKDRAFNSCR